MNPELDRRVHRVLPVPNLHQSPFSSISLLLAVLMIVPPSLVAGVRDARADVANGTCQIVCVEDPPGTINCGSDPDDPDCVGTPVNHICTCADGSSSEQDLNTACDDACANDGGACDLADCFVPPSDQPIEVASLDFFNGNVAPLRLWAFDPDTNRLRFDTILHATLQLIALEQKAIGEVIEDHGLPASDAALVKRWARDRVRAQILTNFNAIIEKDPAARTASEALLYDWLTHLVWKKRIEAAQFALDQYRAWNHAVQLATCDWHSPTREGVVALVRNADGTAGNQTISVGCSPGVDGIPGNDPTPNAGTIEQVLAGQDDGETCFNLPADQSFVINPGGDDTPSYDALTRQRCAGVNNQWDVSLAAHPSVEHFLQYGLAIARKHEIVTPGFASVMGSTFKEEAFGIGLGIAGLAGAGTLARVYSAGGWAFYTKTIAPFSGRTAAKITEAGMKTATGVSTRFAGAIAAALIVFEVIANIVTAVLTLLDIIAYNDVAPKLKAIARAAGNDSESTVTVSENYSYTTGKPNLKTLIATEAGKSEIRFALIEALSPDKEVAGTAPERDPSLYWAQTRADGTPVSTAPLNQLLHVRSWPVNEPFRNVAVGLVGGWFTNEVTGPDGEVTRTLSLGVDYESCDGKQLRAWRVADGQFVSMPMGATAETFDLTETERTDTIQYASFDAANPCLTARINHAPTASGILVAGTQLEGQSISFTATSTDPDGDATSPAWSFGDGGTATGSPVQHAYVDDGSYTVALTASDVYGATGNQRTQSVVIANAKPVVGTIDGPAGRVAPNTTVHLSAAFTDAGVADTHSATWDWGDGTVTSGTVQQGSGSGSVTGAHAYTTGGSYVVKLTVTDDDGGVGVGTFPVTVNQTLSVPDPAKLWIGMVNSDSAAMRLDLQVEVLLGGNVVATGQLLDFKGGSSGFPKAILQSIPLALTSSAEVVPGTTLAVRVGVRATCALGGSRAGRVRLWYGGQPIDSGKKPKPSPGSRVGVQIGSNSSTYYLRGPKAALALATTAGNGRKSIDAKIDSKVKCPDRPFTTFGTWSVVLP